MFFSPTRNFFGDEERTLRGWRRGFHKDRRWPSEPYACVVLGRRAALPDEWTPKRHHLYFFSRLLCYYCTWHGVIGHASFTFPGERSKQNVYDDERERKRCPAVPDGEMHERTEFFGGKGGIIITVQTLLGFHCSMSLLHGEGGQRRMKA